MGRQPGSDPVSVTVLWSAADGDARRVARFLAVRSAAELLGVEPSKVWMSHAASGRPLLNGAGRGTQVSVSHGRGTAAVALCRSPRVHLGVDVETVRPLAARALAHGYLAAAEAHWLDGLAAAERSRAFLWLWTQKEAVGKALGLGLRAGGMSRPMPLPAVWPPPDGGPRAPVAVPGDAATACTAAFVGGGRHVVGVAVRGVDDSDLFERLSVRVRHRPAVVG